jgi:hypothetical protein
MVAVTEMNSFNDCDKFCEALSRVARGKELSGIVA